jgi:hypothetical protein
MRLQPFPESLELILAHAILDDGETVLVESGEMGIHVEVIPKTADEFSKGTAYGYTVDPNKNSGIGCQGRRTDDCPLIAWAAPLRNRQNPADKPASAPLALRA